MMLARFFKMLFAHQQIRPHFYGIHKKIIKPFGWFKTSTIVHSLPNGIKMELHLSDWIQQNLYFLNVYEAFEIAFIYKSLKPGGVFIDVGTNVGWHSLNASKAVGKDGLVICFEPFTLNWNRLNKNISLNPEMTNIHAEKLGVGAESGTITLNYNFESNNAGMASQFGSGGQYEEVQVVALDMYIKQAEIDKIDLIKIDIEGGEYNALLGMEDVLRSFKPILMVEFDSEILKDQADIEGKMYAFLHELGYKPTYFNSKGELCDNSLESHSKNIIFWNI
ncbi:MAG: FkbM family methyltransferase [Flavobacteriales bacterium]|nr:FkbM family methyltransferase [Flavobacteriales bacterium]